jgi:hypothetical protein
MDYMSRVTAEADRRQKDVEAALKQAFMRFIEKREVEVILFCNMTANDLAKAILAQPKVLKPILVACNIAGRAIERDLGIKNLDTYSPNTSTENAQIIAGYIKPFLPPYLEIHALCHLDRTSYVDKEVRKSKGRWERIVLSSLNQNATVPFRKRKFAFGREEFEIDAATPIEGSIRIGVDIKRIEARRDIHKRCDEIANKSRALRSAFHGARFGAVIYYPFIDEHANIQSRLGSAGVRNVVFAGESNESISTAIRMLLSSITPRVLRRD